MKCFACCDRWISSYCSFFSSVAATEPHVSLWETVQHIALCDVHLPAPQHRVLHSNSILVGFTHENPELNVKLLHLMHVSVKGVTCPSSMYLLVSLLTKISGELLCSSSYYKVCSHSFQIDKAVAGRVLVETILHQNKKLCFSLCGFFFLFWQVLFCSWTKGNSVSSSCSALVSSYGLNDLYQETGCPKMRGNCVLRDFCGSSFVLFFFFSKGCCFP